MAGRRRCHQRVRGDGTVVGDDVFRTATCIGRIHAAPPHRLHARSATAGAYHRPPFARDQLTTVELAALPIAACGCVREPRD